MNRLTIDGTRRTGSLPDIEVVRSDDGGCDSEFGGVEIEFDRLLNTLRIFESVRFFVAIGDTRPGFGTMASFVVVVVVVLTVVSSFVVGLFVSGRGSIDANPVHRIDDSFFISSCFKRCRCSAMQNLKLGDSIATLIAFNNNVRK